MSARFRFGEFELDVAAYTLRRAGERIKLERLPMEILVLLVRSAGMLVTRAEVHAALWGPNVFVERDSAINTAIRKLRRTLGDDADQPRFVETMVGKGYRFVAPLETRGGDAVASTADRHEQALPTYVLTRGKRSFVLERGKNLLGRDPHAQVYVDHPSVSRRHACICIDAISPTLEDLQSRNGTFLDGHAIHSPSELHHGAVVGLGPITLTLVILPAGASTRPMRDDTHKRPKAPA